MKNLFVILFIIIVFSGCEEKKSDYEDQIKMYRYALNVQFSDAKNSPLTKDELKLFKGLDFFKIDEKYNITATLELTPNSPVFEMKTNTKELQLYKKYGIIHFELDGKKMSLNIYESKDLQINTVNPNYLFLPFTDTSNGTLTYGGGRYIDLEKPTDSTKIIIDFNKAYNPYCAYNPKYSCPTPPSENSLPIPILAGVKAYKTK